MKRHHGHLAAVAVALSLSGLSGIVAQTLLVRELLVTFGGTELSVGIMLGSWLALEAAGAMLGRLGDRLRDRARLYALATLAFSVALPASLYAARCVRIWAGLAAGEGSGVLTMAAVAGPVILLTSVLHGLLFTLGAGLTADTAAAQAAGRAYAVEALGTAAGGALLTYLLIPRTHAFAVALWLAPLNLASCAILLATRPRGRRFGPFPVALAVASCALVVAGAGGVADRLQERSISRQWPGYEVLAHADSPYAGLTVTRRGEQIDFHVDGRPVVTLPTPDVAAVEDFAHLPLAHHPAPRSILVLGGGAGGVLAEILRHPVTMVDYVEQDPVLLRLLDEYAPQPWPSERNDPRVRLWIEDGRRFLATGHDTYDVILVGAMDPMGLATNRFFTAELLRAARARLAGEGILAVRATGSLTYLGPELRDVNASLLATLREAFPHVRLIPGDTNLYLGSATLRVEDTGAAELVRRLASVGTMRALTPAAVEYRLDPERVRRVLDALERRLAERTDLVNRDTRPVGVLLGLGFRNAALAPAFQRFFAPLASLSLPPLLLAAPAACGALLVLRRRSVSLLFSMGVTGFAGMLAELVLVFLFQTALGTIYQRVGALTAAFMAGTAAGAALSTEALRRSKAPGAAGRLLLSSDAALAGLLGLLALAAPALSAAWAGGARSLQEPAFLAVSAAGGLVVGAQYPLAIELRRSGDPVLSRAVGLVSAADLTGGFAAGLLAGVVLLPVLGIPASCLLLMVWKIAAAVAVAGRPPACRPLSFRRL